MDDAIYTKLYNEYQAELVGVTATITQLETREKESSNKRKAYSEFADLIRQYSSTQTELTRALLLGLVEKVVVHEPVGAKWSKTKTLKIEVHYKGIGCLSPRTSLFTS